MPNRTYKILEVVGVSEDSVQQAVRNAVTRAGSTLSGLDWFEVTHGSEELGSRERTGRNGGTAQVV